MIQIRRNRQIKRNIKQNLKFYNNPLEEATEAAQGVLDKVVIILLAISSGAAAVFGSLNILFRIPDFFRFEFDRVEVSRHLDIGISGTDLGSFFSKFMLHGVDTFSLKAEYEGVERELFNPVEAAMMDNFRALLDILLIVAIVSLILTVACIVFLFIRMVARGLRIALNIALGLYIAALTAAAVYFNVYDGDKVLMGAMMEGKFGADDLLKQMFDVRFTLDTTVATIAISFIIMMVIRYIVWKMTAQKGIFSEGLKGAAK